MTNQEHRVKKLYALDYSLREPKVNRRSLAGGRGGLFIFCKRTGNSNGPWRLSAEDDY